MHATEGIDPDRLLTYLRSAFPELAGDPIFHRFPGGRSNLTYAVQFGNVRLVVRRPPLGHVLATAHDMTREATVLRALAGTPVPVPEVLAVCDDPEVIGAPFLVMSYTEGRVLREPDDIAALGSDACSAITDALLDTLVALHQLDIDAVGLRAFGKPDGYLERQVTRWARQLDASRTRDLPDLDVVTALLAAAAPRVGAGATATVVHGDYRLDNTVIGPDNVVVGVLDWEMATLGDPLTDVALLCSYSGGVAAELVPSAAAIAHQPALLNRDSVLTRYAERTGRSLDDMAFYDALAHYKLAIIAEGIHARYTQGLTIGEGFDTIGTAVPRIAEAARAFAEEVP